MESTSFTDPDIEKLSSVFNFKKLPKSSGRISLKRGEVVLLITGNPRLTPAGEQFFLKSPDEWVEAVRCGKLSSSEVVARLNKAALSS